MGWAKIDDGFHDHPKVDELSLASIGLWTVCLTWANRHRRTAIRPGHITEARVRKAAGAEGAPLVAELVRAGLWEVAEEIGGWVIHDFRDYLPRQRDSAEASESGRKGAAKRWHPDADAMADSHDSDSKEPSEAVATDGSRASAHASPTRPDPKDQKTSSSGARKRGQQRATSAPDVFPITDAMAAWGRENCPLVTDPQAETRQFLDHARANGKRFIDWTAAWRTWMANAEKFAGQRPSNVRSLPAKQLPAGVSPHRAHLYEQR
jgi:hypothetical protein